MLGYIFLAPSLILFTVFMFYPILYTLYLSFFEWNMVKPEKKFVGLGNYIAIFKDPMVWISIISLPINYFLVFIAFFGEEYGWRYYLQSVMQKKFGLRGGVILLGMAWGIWHLPIDLFYYTQTTGLQMIFAQQITCIFLAIFFGYAYMKTKNIWVPVCLHYLNNNLMPIITATFTADVLEDQVVRWSDLPVSLLLNGLCFGFFLLAGEYRRKNIKE